MCKTFPPRGGKTTVTFQRVTKTGKRGSKEVGTASALVDTVFDLSTFSGDVVQTVLELVDSTVKADPPEGSSDEQRQHVAFTVLGLDHAQKGAVREALRNYDVHFLGDTLIVAGVRTSP